MLLFFIPHNLPQALPGDLQFLDGRLRSLLLVGMQNAHVFSIDHGIEEPVAAGRCSNLDFPKLALDMPELAALRPEAIMSRKTAKMTARSSTERPPRNLSK